ncbi:acyclic terpene utilization AtuA family protein [Thioclava sp. F34-6]|uniref:acyclic terpene utilization AtuA family protein n=1 Tax=Thioclava sp. F34-6 TaxID=1973003 RepID=UPI00143A9DB4|nr:acyclic terpene utilization AtuA family protein [Thioclava sp. F34-6]
MDKSAEKVARVGCGSGFAMDRLEPALELARSGKVDYLGFDALAERTLAFAHLRRRADSSKGYDDRLDELLEKFAPYVANGLKIVGSFGAANVEAGAKIVHERLGEMGYHGLKVAAIQGDDVLEQVRSADPYIAELGKHVSELGGRVNSANAYLGSKEVLEALQNGANWIVGGRLCDPALYVGPICHALGWSLDDWDRVAHATLVGHLLECSTHVTGGYFADPPYRVVEGLGNLPFPYAEVRDKTAIITKLEGTGGRVDEQIVAAQVSYEVHDPAAYTNPDIVADFTQVTAKVVGPDRVEVKGARGKPRPDLAKVLVAVDMGYKVVAEISYAASGSLVRAELAEGVIRERITKMGEVVQEHRIDMHGVNTMVGDHFRAKNDSDPVEVRLRVAARCATQKAAETISLEVERLFLEGPAGGGGVSRRVEPVLGVYPVYIPVEQISTRITYMET